jgi:hypothetical protein
MYKNAAVLLMEVQLHTFLTVIGCVLPTAVDVCSCWLGNCIFQYQYYWCCIANSHVEPDLKFSIPGQ